MLVCTTRGSELSRRRNHDAGFEARVALEALGALKGERTVSELASAYGVHPPMVHQWTKALLEGAAGVVERVGRAAPEVDEDTVRDRRAKIGELAVADDPAPGLRGPAGAKVPAAMSRPLKPWIGQ